MTTSLLISKQLKEAGYPQFGDYWWIGVKKWDGKEDILFNPSQWDLKSYQYTISEKSYVSPTTDELMEMLPEYLGHYSLSNHLRIDRRRYLDNKPLEFRVGYFEGYDDGENFEGEDFEDTSLPDALAKMVLYLAEKGVLRWGE